MRNIVIIGFMGTGKTSTGRILSNRLGYAFIDLDQKIEGDNHMTIPEMFRQHGEDYFRNCETKAVAEVAKQKNIVISTGGGTVKRAENMTMLRENGVIISLTASPETILRRTERKGKRPVLDGQDHGDRLKAVIEIMESRRKLYLQADFTVDTSEHSPMQVVNEIHHFLKRRGYIRA